jgi:hypothetical protein
MDIYNSDRTKPRGAVQRQSGSVVSAYDHFGLSDPAPGQLVLKAPGERPAQTSTAGAAIDGDGEQLSAGQLRVGPAGVAQRLERASPQLWSPGRGEHSSHDSVAAEEGFVQHLHVCGPGHEAVDPPTGHGDEHE